MRVWFRSVPSSQFCESPQLFSLWKKLTAAFFCWARWGFDFYLFFFFFLSDIGRKLTERIPGKLTSLYFLHACVSHSWPSQSSFLETAAEMSCNYLFFPSCICSDFDYYEELLLRRIIITKNNYYEESSGQYSTGMAWCASPTLVYSELFSSFLNSVAGSCRQRLRSML